MVKVGTNKGTVVKGRISKGQEQPRAVRLVEGVAKVAAVEMVVKTKDEVTMAAGQMLGSHLAQQLWTRCRRSGCPVSS